LIVPRYEMRDKLASILAKLTHQHVA
jgi:hypothetical protein